MFRMYTTNKPYVSRDMSYLSRYMHVRTIVGSWVQRPPLEPFLALFLALVLALFQHYKCTSHALDTITNNNKKLGTTNL